MTISQRFQVAAVWIAVSSEAQTEGISLEYQEQSARAWCASTGLHIAAVLRVPGHSRRYYNAVEAASAMRAAGIDALDRLLAMIESRAFDVLVVHDGSRLGREQGILSEIVARIIDAGARIYCLADGGWVDSANYRMWIAMNGYRVASEIDIFTSKARQGRENLARRGLSATGRDGLTHVVQRGPNGKIQRLALRPSMESFWQAVADRLLAGLPYRDIAEELFALGFRHPDTGRAIGPSHLRRTLLHPQTWGFGTIRSSTQQYGTWGFGDGSPPAGVIVEQHPATPIAPVFAGDLADRIKAELRRRESMRGSASPRGYQFQGLFFCARCGRTLSRNASQRKSGPYIIWRCTGNSALLDAPKCRPLEYILEPVAIRTLDLFLRRWIALEAAEIERLMAVGAASTATADQIAQAESEIAQLTHRLETLIVQRADAPESVADIYAGRIAALAAQREQAAARLASLQSRIEPLPLREQRRHALTELQTLDLTGFWALPEHEINQLLRRLLGRARFPVQAHRLLPPTFD